LQLPRRFLVLAFLLPALFAVACGGGSSNKTVKLGDLSFNDHGTKDVTNATTLEIEADSFYFSPTFVRGSASQKLRVKVDNETKNTLHNFSLPGLQIDKDVPAGTAMDFELTFPQSGVLLFLCKYHTGSGMNGELLTGSATPQAASAAAPAAPAAAPNVKVADNALGKIVTDASGKSLYTNKNDVANSGKSTVSGATLTVWPVFSIPTGNPVKATDLPGDVAVITRDDGAKQVTYKGMPLYYFARDNGPGDTNGQGIGNVWFVAMP
jgi:predicted lipoprotein with Yx(FWY)xxD motif/plastocyanin